MQFAVRIRRLTLFILLLAVAVQINSGQIARLLSFSALAHQRASQQMIGDGQATATLKLETELISVRVAVTDQHGQAIAGLKKENFAIYDDKVEQPVSFFSEEDSPASVAIVFDASSSMNDSKIAQARDAVARFVQTSQPEDEYSLISFNENARLLLDRTHNSDVLLARIANVHPEGNTALYDGVALAAETVAHSRYAKRAMILVSDGEDNRSRVTFNQLRRMLQETSGTIYTIQLGIPLPHSMSRTIMEQLASVSGGRAFMPRNPEAMTEAFEQIALELRRQYSIGYSPANFVADGKWHRLKVMVVTSQNSPRLVVRNREGYYAVRNRSDRPTPVSRKQPTISESSGSP